MLKISQDSLFSYAPSPWLIINQTKKTQQHWKHEWVWTKQVDEGPYWCYYTHMKWDPSVSWGGVLGDCGRGGGECDRLFTARKKSDMLSALTRHTRQNKKKNELHQQLMIKQPKKTTTIMDQINVINEESTWAESVSHALPPKPPASPGRTCTCYQLAPFGGLCRQLVRDIYHLLLLLDSNLLFVLLIWAQSQTRQHILHAGSTNEAGKAGDKMFNYKQRSFLPRKSDFRSQEKWNRRVYRCH